MSVGGVGADADVAGDEEVGERLPESNLTDRENNYKFIWPRIL